MNPFETLLRFPIWFLSKFTKNLVKQCAVFFKKQSNMHINDIQKLKHQISSKCTNLKIPKRLRLPSQQNAAIHITIQLMRRTNFFFSQ